MVGTSILNSNAAHAAFAGFSQHGIAASTMIQHGTAGGLHEVHAGMGLAREIGETAITVAAMQSVKNVGKLKAVAAQPQ